MTRKLIKTLTLLSVLLCGLTAWWWFASANRIDEVTYERPGKHAVQMRGTSGKVIFSRTVYDAHPDAANLRHVSWGSTGLAGGKAESPTAAIMAFSYNHQPLPGSKGGSISTLILPAWMLTAAFAVLPACSVATKVKPKKKKPAEQS